MREEVHDLRRTDEHEEADDDDDEEGSQAVPDRLRTSVSFSGILWRQSSEDSRAASGRIQLFPVPVEGEFAVAAEAVGATQGDDEARVEEKEQEEWYEDPDDGSEPEKEETDRGCVAERTEVKEVLGLERCRKVVDLERPEGREVD